MAYTKSKVMKELTNVSSIEFVIGLVVIMGIIAAVIFLGRYLFNKTSWKDLHNKHLADDPSTTLRGRSKYPEVDAFRFSGLFLKLGLILSLALIVGAFNWTSKTQLAEIDDYSIQEIVDIEVTPPRSDVLPPPPPPPPAPKLIEEVPPELIDEDEEIEFVDQSIEAETELIVEKPVIEEKVVAPPPPPPPPVEEAEEIFKIVEDMPRFPGCEDVVDKDERKLCSETKLIEFIYSHIVYPQIARENGIQGNVVVQFVVDKQGKIENAEIVRDIGAKCGDEAIRVVHLMNEMGITWIPGKQRGRAVKVRFMLPIRFKLETSI